jgi:imidazolonepropionase-like amidohydrolase
MDMLRAMTINAARLLGVDGKRGTIKPGLAADIIATPENPLDNIQAVRKVSFVMKDGSVFRNELVAQV